MSKFINFNILIISDLEECFYLSKLQSADLDEMPPFQASPLTF